MLKFLKNLRSRKFDFYIASSMRGHPDLNRPLFMSSAKLLRDDGYTVWNPAEHPSVAFAQCMTLDLDAIINKCNGIALLPGWDKSLGANVEAFVAFATGKHTVEMVMKENNTAFDLIPIDLSKYVLPYNAGYDRQFDPHQCDLHSFQEKQ